jgi:hypothetical protein
LREGSLGVSVSMGYNERFAHEKYSTVSPLAASFLKMQASMEAEKSRRIQSRVEKKELLN